MAAVSYQSPGRNMPPPLEFLPYAGKRSFALGDAAKRVVMTSRSPSPEPGAGVAPSPSKPAATTARRIKPTPLPGSPAAASTSASASAAAGASASAPPTPSSPVSTLRTSTPAGTPSRKGKEREVSPDTTGSSPYGTPNGAVNGTVNGTPKKAANGTPRTLAAADASAGELAWPAPFKTARRAAGLHNGSMACYSNATLQVLLHTPPVLHQVKGHHESECVLASRGKFCMLCALRNLALGEHWAGRRVSYNPVAVHRHLGQIKKGFSRNRQEDTHEFFRFVTDALQNTALAGKPKDLPEKLKRKTWVYRTWGGRVRSRVLCLSCKKPSDTFDSFLDLSLDIPPRSRTVGDLLAGFVHEDRLDGENKYHCENCKRKSAALKSMRIEEAPPVLTLHLKRFGFSMSYPGRMTKVNNTITYPAVLDIASYMTGPTDGTRYRLFAVTCHHGTSLNYGHYTSYVRGPDGSWFNADDDDVAPLPFKDVLNDRSAYLLSYVRISPGEGGEAAPMPRAEVPSPMLANGKRRREDDGPSSPATKRSSPPLSMRDARSPLVKSNGVSPRVTPRANGTPNGVNGTTAGSALKANGAAAPASPRSPKSGVSALERLVKAYGSDSGDEGPLTAPQPRRIESHPSPISRLSHPSPRQKNKFHGADPKRGLHGHGHGHGPATPRHRGAPMPFSVGRKQFVASSNMRANGLGNVRRRDFEGRRKGVAARMQGKR